MIADAIVTRDDVEHAVKDFGLTLISRDERGSPTIRLVVTATVPGPSSVIIWPPVEERVESLRQMLRARGPIGIFWVVLLDGSPR